MRTTLLQLAIAATLASAQLQLSTLDDSYAGITYTGTWVHEALPNRPLLYGGTQSYSIDPNASFSFTWTGSAFAICAGLKVDRGQFNVAVDGVNVGTGTQYSTSTDGAPACQIVYSGTGLAYAAHTVVVSNAGNSFLTVDAITVNDAATGAIPVLDTPASVAAALAASSSSAALTSSSTTRSSSATSSTSARQNTAQQSRASVASASSASLSRASVSAALASASAAAAARSPSMGRGMSAGAIVGGVIGGIIVLLLLFAVFWVCCRRKKGINKKAASRQYTFGTTDPFNDGNRPASDDMHSAAAFHSASGEHYSAPPSPELAFHTPSGSVPEMSQAHGQLGFASAAAAYAAPSFRQSASLQSLPEPVGIASEYMPPHARPSSHAHRYSNQYFPAFSGVSESGSAGIGSSAEPTMFHRRELSSDEVPGPPQLPPMFPGDVSAPPSPSSSPKSKHSPHSSDEDPYGGLANELMYGEVETAVRTPIRQGSAVRAKAEQLAGQRTVPRKPVPSPL